MSLLTRILEKLYATVTLGAVLALAMIVWLHGKRLGHADYWGPFFTWLHVLSAIMWVGLLYYFNFVQMPTMPKIPAEQKGAITKFIAPEALFWFRWAALSTVVTGLLVSFLKGYGHEPLMFKPEYRTLGAGMWLGLIMAFNVWFIIWPNQKKALGIVSVDDATKAKSARVAMLTSRVNVALSIPMLYCMIAFGLLG